MNHSAKDRALFTFSGLMIGLGLAAFFFNIKTIHWANAESESRNQHQIFDDTDFPRDTSDFQSFFNEDPFQEMEEMQNRIFGKIPDSSLFPSRDALFSNKNWSSLSTNQGHFKIEKSETADHLIYEVEIEGAEEGRSIDVNVIDQMVTVTGRRVDQSGRSNETHRFYSSSTFSQSFSLPPGLDTENVEMENFGHRVVLKFPKLKSEV